MRCRARSNRIPGCPISLAGTSWRATCSAASSPAPASFSSSRRSRPCLRSRSASRSACRPAISAGGRRRAVVSGQSGARLPDHPPVLPPGLARHSRDADPLYACRRIFRFSGRALHGVLYLGLPRPADEARDPAGGDAACGRLALRHLRLRRRSVRPDAGEPQHAQHLHRRRARLGSRHFPHRAEA